jgi:hypothetical protein
MRHVLFLSMLRLRQPSGNIPATKRSGNATTNLIDHALSRGHLLFAHFGEIIEFTVLRLMR